MQEITQEYLKEIFNYHNSNLYWKVPRNGIRKDKKAGYIEKHGYGRISINDKRYGIHCLIFLYHCGYYPKIIDHIDGNPLNNKIENLRESNQSQNMMDSKPNKNHSSIYKGISWHKGRQHWKVTITINNKEKYLGSSKSEIKAAKIYNKGAIELFGEYAYLNEFN